MSKVKLKKIKLEDINKRRLSYDFKICKSLYDISNFDIFTELSLTENVKQLISIKYDFSYQVIRVEFL